MAEGDAAIKASEIREPGGAGLLKKNKTLYSEMIRQNPKQRVRVMSQDEAGFGRINRPKSCWCRKGERQSVPCHHVREYRYAYGAVEPKKGESFFLILPYCNTVCMNGFLAEMAKAYPKDRILLVDTLDKVMDRLCEVIKNLPASVIQSITGRQWLMSMF